MKPVRQKIYGADPYKDFDRSWANPDLQGWGHEHGIFSKCIKQLKPQLIIEVGTWKGASAIRMAQICREQGLDPEIICVDTWLGPPAAMIHREDEDPVVRMADLRIVNGFPLLYFTFMRNVLDAGFQDLITPLPQTSENAAKILAYYKVAADLVYLDAAVDTGGVYRDLGLYWKLLRPGGQLIGDDYKRDGVRKGVARFAAAMKIKPEDYGGKYRLIKP